MSKHLYTKNEKMKGKIYSLFPCNTARPFNYCSSPKIQQLYFCFVEAPSKSSSRKRSVPIPTTHEYSDESGSEDIKNEE